MISPQICFFVIYLWICCVLKKVLETNTRIFFNVELPAGVYQHGSMAESQSDHEQSSRCDAWKCRNYFLTIQGWVGSRLGRRSWWRRWGSLTLQVVGGPTSSAKEAGRWVRPRIPWRIAPRRVRYCRCPQASTRYLPIIVKSSVLACVYFVSVLTCSYG